MIHILSRVDSSQNKMKGYTPKNSLGTRVPMNSMVHNHKNSLIILRTLRGEM